MNGTYILLALLTINMNQKYFVLSQSISVRYLQPGMYLLMLIGNSQMQTSKFIKK